MPLKQTESNPKVEGNNINKKEIQISSLGTSQLYLNNAIVTIHEIKHSEVPEESVVRVWCTRFPNSFSVQFRTNNALDTFNKGIKRNMIATAHLTVKDVEEILAYMKNESKRLGVGKN